MEIRKAFYMGKEKGHFIKSCRFQGKIVRQLFGFFTTRQAGHLIVTAGAIGGQYRYFVLLLLFAAVGDMLMFVIMLLFLLPAAAFMGGAHLGRAAADIAITYAFPCNSVGD